MSRHRTRLSAATTCAVVAAAGLVAGLVVGPAPAVAGPGPRSPIARTAPDWVTFTKSTGQAAPNARTSVRVYLAPRGGLAQLKADVAAVSDPGSSDYANFLSAKQFHARYDATDAQIRTVSTWLADNGLAVTATEQHHRYLEAAGTTSAVEKAFAVDLRTFRHNGQTVQAPTAAASVPASIATLVTTVTGLDTTKRLISHVDPAAQNPAAQSPAAQSRAAQSPAEPSAGPPPPAADGFRTAGPCSRYYGQRKARGRKLFERRTLPYAVCGYTGSQLRRAYAGTTRLDGGRVTVAITDAYASPTIAQDVATYARAHGERAYRAGQLSQHLPVSFNGRRECDETGWWGEQTLDIEAVHAMAPAANIAYYAASSCYDRDFLNTLARVVDDNVASLVSNSWSDVESNESPESVAAYEQIFLQGAMQGIGFLFSSGDDGDEEASSGLRQVGYPASDPYVTAVGGTADAIKADGTFAFQTGWGTHRYPRSDDGRAWESLGFAYGAGGGSSALFPQPSYQAGVVPETFGNVRAVPDLAMTADPTTGMLVGQTQKFSDGTYYDEYRIGGTSLASPLVAGMAALKQQAAGHRLGFLNPAIYAGHGTPAFKDIAGSPRDRGNVRVDFVNGENADQGLRYSVGTFNEDSSLSTGPGWDDVTGVGSPTAAWLQ